MAIQMRRGKYSAFLPSKMKPGEWAVVQGEDPDTSDGMSVYIAFAAGVVKRMATYTDMVNDVRTIIEASIEDIKSILTAKVEKTNSDITEAEKGRVAAELARVEAEASRVSAESARADKFEEVVSEAEQVNVSVSGTVVSVTDRHGVVTAVDILDVHYDETSNDAGGVTAVIS